MELTGYADQLSVQGGDRIEFKVSTDLGKFDASIVRLIHGDSNGPGFQEEHIADCGSFPGRKQVASSGSYILIDGAPSIDLKAGLTICAWIYPTSPERPTRQGIVGHASGQDGYGFFIGPSGRLGFGFRAGSTDFLASDGPILEQSVWTFVAVVLDPVSGTAGFYNTPAPHEGSELRYVSFPVPDLQTAGVFKGKMTLAALTGVFGISETAVASQVYNGKLESVAIFNSALTATQLANVRSGSPDDAGVDAFAFWDFSAGIEGATVSDTGANGFTGRAINMPMRAVVGHNWNGEEICHKHAPHQYAAIHFHDDDLEDAGWETDFTWNIPSGLRSGVYAARLTGETYEDHIVFAVRPDGFGEPADVVLLLPTMTYLAYANEACATFESLQELRGGNYYSLDKGDYYLREHPELGNSLYDSHSDGSGVCYSSSLRPIINMRPKYRQWQYGAPRHLGADLYIVDWLESQQIPYHVITDHDLHNSGSKVLKNYKVMITGTHPEYWTSPMQQAIEDYHEGGGRQMYLGGNGYYWVTSVDEERPHVIEVRRGVAGTRTWQSHPGELYHSSTAELGGLWRHRGKSPNQLVGVGFKAMGDGAPAPGYQRREGSFDPRASFIFEGIGEDEVIGDFGLVLGGASGDEIDCMDHANGTPSHTLLLATASGHSPDYMAVVEDLIFVSQVNLAVQASRVCADMVYLETPNGGAVFSVGAISWCGSLSHNNYDNNVSRVTLNALRGMLR